MPRCVVLGKLNGAAWVQVPDESAKAQNKLQVVVSSAVPATVTAGIPMNGAVLAMRSVPLPEMRNNSELTKLVPGATGMLRDQITLPSGAYLTTKQLEPEGMV